MRPSAAPAHLQDNPAENPAPGSESPACCPSAKCAREYARIPVHARTTTPGQTGPAEASECAQGRSQSLVPLIAPRRTIHRQSSAAYPVVMALPARDSELIQIMDAELARVTHISGSWLACRPGCTQCCHGAFTINTLDTARLRAGMESLRQTNPALAIR